MNATLEASQAASARVAPQQSRLTYFTGPCKWLETDIRVGVEIDEGSHKLDFDVRLEEVWHGDWLMTCLSPMDLDHITDEVERALLARRRGQRSEWAPDLSRTPAPRALIERQLRESSQLLYSAQLTGLDGPAKVTARAAALRGFELLDGGAR